MALISFSRATTPVASITFAENPSVRRYGGVEDYFQLTEKSEGSNIYTYDYGLDSNQIINFGWNAMSYDNFILLIHFYESMQKTMYNFTFTDFDSTSVTAWFISPINWTYIKSNLLEVSFDLFIKEDRAY